MIASVAGIWRYPVKGHGAEELDSTQLIAGQVLPGDRLWAVAHDAARVEDDAWAPCQNFSRGAKVPGLMAIAARSHGDGLTLTHPDLGSLTFDPETEGARLVDWVAPLTPPGRARPARLVRAGSRGMTDSDWPSVSVLNLSSLRALGQKLGQTLDPRRFRGNLVLDGLGPWEEFEWIGRRLRIGTAELTVRERITRCAATTANPATGRVDADTLGALEDGWGHRDFGVYAEVTGGGTVRHGDRVEVVA